MGLKEVIISNLRYIYKKTKCRGDFLYPCSYLILRQLMINSPEDRFFTEKIMHWHHTLNKRKMPWKGEKDPYKIWLSEIILQQTRVEQGTGYYLRFIKEFPTVQKLASAGDDAVFKLWEGLGYYSRCKNLLVSARQIAFEEGGIFPPDYNSILKMKGVGPYTAAAIASFAYNLPHAVADGNVLRLLARYYCVKIPIDNNEGKKFFSGLAQSLLDKKAPGTYNQAIMDYGAVICKPKLPLCNVCILKSNCKAFQKDMVAHLPVKINRLVKKQRRFYFIIAEFDNNIYVRKRTGKDIWQNLWEFLLFETEADKTVEDLLHSPLFLKTFSEMYKVKYISDHFKQQLTHQSIEGIFIYITLAGPLKIENYSAVKKKDLAKLAFPRMVTNFFESGALERIGRD